MYVMYGEVNERREVVRSEIAGLFPAGDSRNCENCSVYNWTIGHVIPVASEIGASDGDLEEQYVLARYRVWIDAAQYKGLVAYIKNRKANLSPWHAFLNNCVTFGRDVALFLDLNVPPMMRIAPSVVMYPQSLVESIRDANGGEKDQGPLKDAPGAFPAEFVAKLHVGATKKNQSANMPVTTASRALAAQEAGTTARPPSQTARAATRPGSSVPARATQPAAQEPVREISHYQPTFDGTN
jgi:hypothetical protein